MPAAYATETERPPLGSYAAAIGIFNGGFLAALALARRRGHELPERVGAGDVVLVGVAG